MLCLEFEPGVAGWQAQTKPQSYGSHPKVIFVNLKSLGSIVKVGKDGPFPVSISLFFSFQYIVDFKQMFKIYSNRGPLGTALPTEPQPLSLNCTFSQCSTRCTIKWIDKKLVGQMCSFIKGHIFWSTHILVNPIDGSVND